MLMVVVMWWREGLGALCCAVCSRCFGTPPRVNS